MKNFAVLAAAILALILALVGINAVIRWTSNVTTSVSITQPAPGVRCALASTSNGVGLDCDWSKK